MGYVNGITVCEIEGQNIYTFRFEYSVVPELQYVIDHSNVGDIRGWDAQGELTMIPGIMGPKTVIEIRSKSNWYAFHYSRFDFIEMIDGHWYYSDNWRLSNDTLFCLTFPPHAVIDENQLLTLYQYKDRIIGVGIFSEDTQFDVDFVISSNAFARLELEKLTSLQGLVRTDWGPPRKENRAPSRVIEQIRDGLDWLQRGYMLVEIVNRIIA